ncbi:hypothetical protein NFI96_014527 [Prochilodus magdalenae]|nr:hypothetical protein NFI96_014527 [Prochilodus magdalenae]
MDSFKTSTLNVNGARDGGKRAKVMELVRQKGLDVVMLQETHSDVNNSADWVKEWEGLAVLSHHTSMSGGVAVLFAKSFIPCSYDVEEVVPGRLLKVRACFENEVFVFICVYAPTVGTERLAFLDTLHRVVQNTDVNDLLVLGGDFNCTAADMDRNHMEPHPASRRRLCELVEANELSDVWRTLHAEQRQYTWTHFKDRMLSLARLDRLYVFKHHCSVVSRCFIYPVGFTDHCMVQCAFRKPRVKPRSAYWHFNTALLDDANFRESFIFFWDTFRLQRPSFSSVLEWWDMAKIQTRVFCQQYTLNVTRDIARSLKALEMEIVELQNLGATTGNREHIKTLKSKTATLADLLGARVQGALVRSRFQSVSEMDAPSKFFFGLEQKNGQKRFMHAVRTESGDLLSEPAEIRKRTVSFFLKLYNSEQSGAPELEESFLHWLPKLPRRSAETLDRALSLDELYTALQGMENGRAPGIDGPPCRILQVLLVCVGAGTCWMCSGQAWYYKLLLEIVSCQAGGRRRLFDRVEHGYLWKVLENLGFSSCFIAMIKVLYSDIESVLKVNGLVVRPPFSGGVRSPDFQTACTGRGVGFKYLGVYLGDGDFMKKNWEDVLERIKGRLMKWQWLVQPNGPIGARCAYYKQPGCVVPMAQAGLCRPSAKPVGGHPGDASGLFFGTAYTGYRRGFSTCRRTRVGKDWSIWPAGLRSSDCSSLRDCSPALKVFVWRVPVSRVLQTVEGLGLDRALFLSDTRTLDFGGLPVFYKRTF